MPILTLEETQKQLDARRLENEELRLRLTRLENRIASVTEVAAAAPIVTNNGVDSYLNKDTVYHKLKHLFEKAVTFIVALTVPNGGTGATSFTATQVLTGNGSSAITSSADLVFASNTLTVNRIITAVSSTAAGIFNSDSPTAYNAGINVKEGGTQKWFFGRLGTTSTWVVHDDVGNNTAFQLETGNKMAFFGGTPIVKQTLSAYTTNDQSATYTATPLALINAATLADLNALRTAYENMRAMVDNLRTKVQSTTLVG